MAIFNFLIRFKGAADFSQHPIIWWKRENIFSEYQENLPQRQSFIHILLFKNFDNVVTATIKRHLKSQILAADIRKSRL